METLVAELTIRVDSTEKSLTRLQNQKWRQKYEAEHLQLITVQEEYALSTRRYKGQVNDLTATINNTGGPSPDVDSIIAENIQLKDEYIFVGEKLRLAETELEQLREFYSNTTGTPAEDPLSQGTDLEEQRKNRVEALIVSVKNMGDFRARFVIQNGVANIGKITSEELASLAKEISGSTERRYLLTNIAPFAEYPLNAKQLASIVKNMSDFDIQFALKALQDAEAKFLDQ